MSIYCRYLWLWGAGEAGQSRRHLHKSYSYGVLAMDAYAFPVINPA